MKFDISLIMLGVFALILGISARVTGEPAMYHDQRVSDVTYDLVGAIFIGMAAYDIWQRRKHKNGPK